MTRFLLDTHAFIWLTEGNPQLSATARHEIEDSTHEIWVSVASLWEIAIKVSLGKLELSMPLDSFFAIGLDKNGLNVLPAERCHMLKLPELPFHHRDPFDRLLAAQSLVESMSLLSADVVFDLYGVDRDW